MDKIVIGADHGGFELKNEVISHLKEKGYEVTDVGTFSADSCDYPVYARKVTDKIVSKECDKGIIICGTGIGVSMTANKVKGIRAALCHDVFSAEATRLHNDANVLTMGARVVGPGLALMIVDTFLNTEFSNESRHIRRVNMIEDD
ncbi:MAG: ribose 5-phosphate isomerase B [Lachnospiraceae bacterium]|nr:ribose 5-phosphate isomerase B [Lachnospiraceae bacterium]